tara:strand:- start:45 stop:713 length:669 start_codon:yes stop_codon:yes gene_type:complete
MYSFAQRQDFGVVDEPLFAHFLDQTGANRPSRAEVLATMPTSRARILPTLESNETHVFLKHMANHLEGWPEPQDFAAHRNVLLIRHPRKVLKSYLAHIDAPTALDLCYHHQQRWFERCQTEGWPVAVVDSDRLVAEPESSLRAIMAWVDLDFDPRMLSWPAGHREEDGLWAKYWYHRVHASTGWEMESSSDVASLPPVEERLLSLVDETEPLYESLRARALN